MSRHPTTTALMMASGTAMLGVVLLAGGAGQRPLTPSAFREHPAIRYQEVRPQDPVAQLAERLAGNEVQLEFDPVNGYLRSVLSALKVPESSQLMVFSKTSFQAPRITPRNPRALFFNDTVSVGFVRGGEVLELLAQDPRQGAIFYTLDQTREGAPHFRRELSCVQCHTGETTLEVPGWFVSSVYPDHQGRVLFAPVFSSDHRTGFDFRWGGWYVAGQHEFPRHLGNATVAPGTVNEDMVTAATIRTSSLEGKFDDTGYLSQQSDIVALMVLEHQSHLLNLMTRAGWQSRIGWTNAAALDEQVEELVDYLLFVDEAPLPSPVRGSSGFAQAFSAQGPRDAKGRSLRDFDLTERLMRYRCSFLIYSAPFDALPDDVRKAVYSRMWEVLSGDAGDPRYERLFASERQAVIEILRDTKPELRAYFDAATSG